MQQLAITLTIKSGAGEVNYPTTTTDSSGFFTVTADLPDGVYSWRVKGPKFLANSGTFTLVRGTTIQVEMGLMRAGDANNDNRVSIADYGILHASFGKMFGDPGYDDRADFTGDQVVNIQDLNLLKINFGTGGAPPITPFENKGSPSDGSVGDSKLNPRGGK